MERKYETRKVFHIILKCLRYLGVYPSIKSGIAYYLYSIFINLFITICYPATMLIDVFLSNETKDLFGNLSTTVATVMCGIKTLNGFYKRRQLRRINQILGELDERVREVNDPDEEKYLERIVKMARRIFTAFATPFGTVALICYLPVVFSEKRILLYSAWFPFNWEQSNRTYFAVFSYQLIGIWILIVQNFLNDSYPGVYLWVLKGHFRALNIRVSKIGYDLKQTSAETYKELVNCILDHKQILEYRDVFESAFGGVLLLQFFVTELTLCLTAVCIHFANSKVEMVYTLMYFVCMTIEICLPCYCGNEIVRENEHFMNALYSCNWIEQDIKFKRALIIVMQNAQKPPEIYAGGLVKVSLSTLVAVLKSTYSLFAIMDQMR